MGNRRRELLVVAGEASGDAMAAGVVAELGARAFGLGGHELERVGVDLVAHLREFTSMGFGTVAARGPAIAGAAARLLGTLLARRPRAALLVGYSELNGWLGPRLRARGVRVLWYGAPQIWAWRESRGQKLRRSADRLAVLLPFEEPLWRRLGADARYVGHPALDEPKSSRDDARSRLAIAPGATGIALLPGSRPHEVRRHLPPMLGAIAQLRRTDPGLEARLLLTPSLDRATKSWAIRRSETAGVPLPRAESRAAGLLPGFDTALASSGTVTLECALARVPPVVVYRTGPIAGWIARALVRLDHIALPNILLDRRAFPELVQSDVTAAGIALAAHRTLEHGAVLRDACDAVEAVLRSPRPGAAGASSQVATMMAPWFG